MTPEKGVTKFQVFTLEKAVRKCNLECAYEERHLKTVDDRVEEIMRRTCSGYEHTCYARSYNELWVPGKTCA